MSSKNNVHQGHTARKRFGQNFLTDPELIRDIAESAEPQEADHVIEIGPGLGAITEELVASGAQMTLVELDRDLVARLELQYHGEITKGTLNIINADILKTDIRALLELYPAKNAKLIGNLPYNISTPVLFHILNHQAYFESMTFMLQKEVVDRMSAPSGTSAYSSLSVILQLECDIEKLFDVPPESFQPPPKVDSAVVQLRQKKAILIDSDQRPAFRTFVHQCFQQRRKTLRNNLKGLLDAAQIEALGIDPQLRPERLVLEHYVSLFKVYTQSV